MPLLDLSALRPPDGALLFGSLDAPRDVAEGCVEVTLTLDDHESSPRTTRACPASTARSSRADEPSPFDADPREGASRSPKARWWRSVVGPAADPRPSPPDPDLAPLQRLDFAFHLDATVGDRALLTVAAPPDPTASPCVLARHALEIVAPAQELALRLPSPDAARCDPNAVEPPGPSPAFVPVVPPLLRDVLAFVVVARWLWTRLRGERRADNRTATRTVTTNDPNRRAPSSASLPPDTPPPPSSFAAWRAALDAALDAAPLADPSSHRLVDWTLTATVARNLPYDRDRDSNPRARGRDLVAAFLAAPPRRPHGVGWPEHDPAPEWDDDDDDEDRPEGLSGGTASTWGVSEDERDPPSASGWTTTTAGTGTMGTVTTGTTRSTVVAGRDAEDPSEERALMCDEEPLGVDARARDSFDPIARRPRASRVSEDSARPLSGEGGLLVRAWGTSGDPADARRMLGDWAETPHFERATLRMFPPGTLDRATGVPRFGKGAELGAETWSLAREGFDADEHPERDETKPPAATVPVAVFEETDDDGDVDDGGIEATREGIPGRHPGYHLRGYHPTPPAASDHGITAALFEDPVAGRGTPTPAPSPAGVDHERGWWIRTRGDKSRPTPPR